MPTIQQLANSFIQEAITSPVLMNDLATMEMYIAESYTGRSLIELLQNADDADAARFLVQSIDDSTFIAANNGREFTPEDLQALCRSGASTKQRKSNTIGFRGIGFKAVVNYSENVHVISGGYSFTFSRDKSSRLLPQNIKVPLIRIPHEYNEIRYNSYVDELINQGYRTIFIFETINNKLMQEIKEFSADCALFLNNISEIVFYTDDSTKTIKSQKTKNSYGTLCRLDMCDNKSEWLVMKAMKGKSSIAFKWSDDRIIPCERDEAVVHSFLPTQENLSIPLKVNGDFSTEPSRARVACDDETAAAVSSCAELIASLFDMVLHNGKDEIGIINILGHLKYDPISELRGIRVNDLVNEEFIKVIKASLSAFSLSKNKKNIFIQPTWLNDDDIDSISADSDMIILGSDEERAMPGIKQLLARAGIKEYTIVSALKESKKVTLTPKTRINLINTIANDIYGFSNERVSLLKQAKLFDADNDVISIAECNPDTVFSNEFAERILGTTEDTSKISYLLKKIGLSEKQLNSFMPTEKPEPQVVSSTQSFEKKVIKKWRSVEKNVAALLKMSSDVLDVEDVSEKNLGYDIKVKNKDGTEYYYEVKSVNYLGDTISITNNEYSTADDYGNCYFLAIAQQSEKEMKVCFICNPLKKLNLSKRVVRWEWIANSYEGVVVEAKLVGDD